MATIGRYSGIGHMAGIACRAPLANTGADLSIRNGTRVMCERSWEDRYAYDVKYAGEYTMHCRFTFCIALGGKGACGLEFA